MTKINNKTNLRNLLTKLKMINYSPLSLSLSASPILLRTRMEVLLKEQHLFPFTKTRSTVLLILAKSFVM